MSRSCLATFSFPPSFFFTSKKMSGELVDRSINSKAKEVDGSLESQCHQLFIKIFTVNLQGSFFQTIDGKAQ